MQGKIKYGVFYNLDSEKFPFFLPFSAAIYREGDNVNSDNVRLYSTEKTWAAAKRKTAQLNKEWRGKRPA